MLVVDGVLVEEKSGADKTLVEEIGSESCKPLEQVEASTGLENEERDHLLYEEANYDGVPLDAGPVPGCDPKAKLEHDEADNGDCAVPIARALVPHKKHGSVSGYGTRVFFFTRIYMYIYDAFQKKLNKPTFSILKPNAEPMTIATSASHPMP